VAAVSERKAVEVELDDERNLTSDGVLLEEIVREIKPFVRRRRRRPPIIYCVVGEKGERRRIKRTDLPSPTKQVAQQIAEEIAQDPNADAVEIPVGRAKEPRLTDVTDEIRELADLGVTVRVRLPE
jgi:hypothetical protein